MEEGPPLPYFSSVPLTFPHYALPLAQRPKDTLIYEHEASSPHFKVSSFHSFGAQAPRAAALYSLVE